MPDVDAAGPLSTHGSLTGWSPGVQSTILPLCWETQPTASYGTYACAKEFPG